MGELQQFVTKRRPPAQGSHLDKLTAEYGPTTSRLLDWLAHYGLSDDVNMPRVVQTTFFSKPEKVRGFRLESGANLIEFVVSSTFLDLKSFNGT